MMTSDIIDREIAQCAVDWIAYFAKLQSDRAFGKFEPQMNGIYADVWGKD
jgi:hypothetical protein